MTSGPMPSPAMTAILNVFTNRLTAQPPNRRSFESRRLATREAVGPSDIHRAAARRTLEIAFLGLAAMRAKPYFAARRQDPTAVLTLVLGQHVGGAGDTKAGRIRERSPRRCWGRRRYRILARRVEQIFFIRVEGRRICAVRLQRMVGGASIYHHLRIGKAAKESRVRIDGCELALHGLAHSLGLELEIAALAREQPQHGHLVILMRRDVQSGAIRSIGNQPLVHLGGGEGNRNTRFARERGDQEAKEAIQFVHFYFTG